MAFPPCRLVFAEQLLIAGAGPRSVFGRDRQGRARAVMVDIADEVPSRRVRQAFLASARRFSTVSSLFSDLKGHFGSF